MPQWMKALCVALLLVGGAAVGGTGVVYGLSEMYLHPLSASGGKHGAPQLSEGAKNQGKTTPDHRGTESAPFIVKMLNAPNQAADPDDTKQQDVVKLLPDWGSAEWSIVWATLVLAFIGAGQLLMFFQQLRFMKNGMDDAKTAAEAAKMSADALIAAQRAFVYVFKYNYGTDFNTLNFWMGPEWRNSGTTPTKKMRTHVVDKLMDIPLPPNFSYPAKEISTAFLGPQATIMGARVPDGGIPMPDIIKVMKGEKFLYLMGWVKYFDIFPGTKEHITRFCYNVNFVGDPQRGISSLTVMFSPDEKNNCADEGCDE